MKKNIKILLNNLLMFEVIEDLRLVWTEVILMRSDSQSYV